MIRAKKRAQDLEEATDRRNEVDSGVCPNKLLTDSVTNLMICSSLTRSEKRTQRQKYEEMKRACSGAEEFQKLQRENVTLEQIRKAADIQVSGFFKKKGLVYRRWLPRGKPKGDEVEQLVLPLKYQPEVLKLAHKRWPPGAGYDCKSDWSETQDVCQCTESGEDMRRVPEDHSKRTSEGTNGFTADIFRAIPKDHNGHCRTPP